MLWGVMDTFGKQLADAKASKAKALDMLAQIDAGQLTLAKGKTENQAREILRLNIAAYDEIISRFGWRSNA